MLRRLYDWTMDLAARKNAVWVLCAVAFVESSVFPLPPDILLIPMVLASLCFLWGSRGEVAPKEARGEGL